MKALVVVIVCATAAMLLAVKGTVASDGATPPEIMRSNPAAFTFCERLLGRLKLAQTHPRCLPSGVLVIPSRDFNLCVREERHVNDQATPPLVYYQAFNQCPASDVYTTYFCSPQCYQWAYSESLRGVGVPPNEQSLQNLHSCPRFYQWTGGDKRMEIHFSRTARLCFATPLELRAMTDPFPVRTSRERSVLRTELEKYMKIMDGI